MNKSAFYVLCLLVLMLGFFAPRVYQSFFYAEIWLENDIHDFGYLLKGDDAQYYIKFKNIGNVDLELIDVQTDCGCTIVDWGNSLVKPNQWDSILVKYDTHSTGTIDRQISILTNTKEDITHFYLMGSVL